MKYILNILIILIFAKNSLALTCKGCEIESEDEICEFSYKCPKGTKTCETLVSKVNGNYSIILACASDDKCSENPIYEDGLSECKHSKIDTECYSCCKGDNCNTLESALEELPEDIFEIKKTAKGKKKKSKKNQIDDDDESGAEIQSTDDEDTESEIDEEMVGKKSVKEKSKKTDELEKSDSGSDDMKKNSDDDQNETMEAIGENPIDGELFENNDNNGVKKENSTVIAPGNETAKIAVNNGGFNEPGLPLDENLNLQEIDRKLNETIIILKDEANNFSLENSDKKTENVANSNQNATQNTNTIEIADNAGVNTKNLEGTKVDGGTVYEAANKFGTDSEDVEFKNTTNVDTKLNEESNIMNEGENANEITEQHEFVQSSSNYFKISSAVLAFSSIMILIGLF